MISLTWDPLPWGGAVWNLIVKSFTAGKNPVPPARPGQGALLVAASPALAGQSTAQSAVLRNEDRGTCTMFKGWNGGKAYRCLPKCQAREEK